MSRRGIALTAIILLVITVGYCSMRNVATPLGASFNDVAANLSLNDVNGAAMNAAADMTENMVDVADPNEVIFCGALRDRATRSDCNYYNEVLAKLDVGAGGVDMPDALNRGDTATISFAVSANPAETPVPELLGAKSKKNVMLKIGRLMGAQLQGDGFNIDPIGLQEKDLFIGQGARWDWRVTALKASRHRLLLSAYVVVPGPDKTGKPNLLKTLELPLPVRVTWGQWFDDFVSDATARLNATTALVRALLAFLTVLGLLATALGLKKLWRWIKRKRRRP